MKYLCLGYFNKEKMDALTKIEVDALLQECQVHLETLGKSGHMLIDAGVAQEARSLRRVDGQVQVANGHAQPKKMLGSAFILEALDIEEAIEAASLHPTVQISHGELLGWEIEIRAIDSFDMKDRL